MHIDIVEEPLNTEDITVKGDRLISLAQKRFFASEQCDEAREQLQAIVDSGQYDTQSSYYAASSFSFIERHLNYLSLHPNLGIHGYISNLKLMTRIRSI